MTDIPSCFKNREERREAFEKSGLYPVVSSEFCAGRNPYEVLCRIAEGGARIVQIREKNMDKRAIYELAVKFRPVANQYGVLVMIDDHADVALAAHADGVHCGQTDLPVSEVRKFAPELLLGVSTHNPVEIREACASDADYLNIGPIYPTSTKSVSYPVVGVEHLKEWMKQASIPFSVMGGIKEKQIQKLLSMGVRHIAMVTEITQAPDIATHTAELVRNWLV